MNLEKVRAAFTKKGYNSNTFIRKNQYMDLLNSLMTGQAFDQQVAKEIWQQAADGRQNANELRVDDICTTIVEGQNILQNRLAEIGEQIASLERQKTTVMASGNGKFNDRVAKIEHDLQNLYQDKSEYEEDFRLVSEPFGINPIGQINKHSSLTPLTDRHDRQSYSSVPNNQNMDNISPEGQHIQLKWVLYLTLAFCFIEIIIVYGKYEFLNLIVVTCLLSIYLLDFFDQIYLKFTLALLVVSVVLDVIWMGLYAGVKWNPAKVSNESAYEVGYQRFIVFLSVVIIIIKVPLGWFLFKYRNASPDNKYQLSLGLVKIVLSANKTNPISRGINNNIAS